MRIENKSEFVYDPKLSGTRQMPVVHDAEWRKKGSERASVYKSHRWRADPEWRQRYKDRESKRWRTCLKTRLMNYRRCAEKRGIAFSLITNEASELFQQPCAYCGTFDAEMQNGIDRVDNERPYEKGNTVSCCTQCNMMKRDRSENVFLEHVARICEFQHASVPTGSVSSS